MSRQPSAFSLQTFALLLIVATPLAGQDPAARALDFERRADNAGAAAAWKEVLAGKPTDLPRSSASNARSLRWADWRR